MPPCHPSPATGYTCRGAGRSAPRRVLYILALLPVEWVSGTRKTSPIAVLDVVLAVSRSQEMWHDSRMRKHRRLWDTYRFTGFRPSSKVQGVFGDPKARVVTLIGGQKNGVRRLRAAPRLVRPQGASGARSVVRRHARLSGAGGPSRACRSCGKVKQERLEFLADNPFYTKRFAFYVGRRCRDRDDPGRGQGAGLDWHTVKELEKQYMRAQLRRAGTPAPQGDRHRRDLDPQGAHLPHRGQRPDPAAGRSGSAARTAPRRAWTCSTTGWAEKRPSASGWR